MLRMARLEVLEELERVRVVAARARLAVEARHGLEVVVHDVGRRGVEDLERALEAPAEVGDEDLDARRGRPRAHRADAVDEMPGAAVPQVVAVDAGDDDVGELERRDGLREVRGLLGDRAAAACPCATSQNGQRRVHRSPRIMKVAVPLPKHSPMLGQEASSQTVCSFFSRRICLISVKREPPRRRARGSTRALRRRAGRRDRDRDARLREAFLLSATALIGDSRSCAMRRASASPSSCALASTPCAEVWVTARPG